MKITVAHRLLDFLGLIIGALVTYNWTVLGFDPATAATITAYILLSDKVVKFLLNLAEGGVKGLFTGWDTNTAHTVLNALGLFVGGMLAFDWARLGLDPVAATHIAAGFLTADKVIKFALNVNRGGIGGLFIPPARLPDR